MSSFLKDAAAAAKTVEAARKARAKAESAAGAKFAKAEEAFKAAKAVNAKAVEEASKGEIAAWQHMMDSLGVSAELAAQIVGVDASYVKELLNQKAAK